MMVVMFSQSSHLYLCLFGASVVVVVVVFWTSSDCGWAVVFGGLGVADGAGFVGLAVTVRVTSEWGKLIS